MFEEKLLEPHFTSVLAPYMLDVVEQKRALGNKYNAGVEALSAFDDFCNEQQLRIPAISKELLQKWEKKRPHENETTQCFRISYVRILCKYLHSNGYDAPCAFHPAPHVNKCFVPYIFTKDEIERLFSAVDCTKESSESPLRHLVMPVLFRLLYTCGLRVSEALHLKVGVTQVDAVTDLCHLVAGFCGALDRHSHLVQPGLAAEPARIGSQRTTQSFGGVDALPLVAAVGLNKRTSCCFGERKYFSSTSLIKISDNVHAVS